MTLIRGTSLQGYRELVEEFGGDADSLLARVHLRTEAVGDHDSFLNYRSVIAALELAATETGAPDFGRRLALRQGLDILGPVGVAARTAATVGAALQAIEQYLSVYSPALSARIDQQPQRPYARLEWRITSNRPPPHRQAAELSIGVSVRMFRLLAGADFRPISVSFRHQPSGARRDYVAYFGCPVHFAADETGFLFPRTVLARPLASDGGVHEVVRDYLSTIAVPPDAAALEPIRLLIRRLLLTGVLTIEVLAEHLALHPRTLQRQLAAQGTSFAALVDEVRQDEAARYLRETEVPLSQLAGILGYSEQSVLTRSCRRWFGVSPSAVRRADRIEHQ